MDLLDSFFYNNCDTKISSPVKLPKKGLELLQEMNFSEIIIEAKSPMNL